MPEWATPIISPPTSETGRTYGMKARSFYEDFCMQNESAVMKTKCLYRTFSANKVLKVQFVSVVAVDLTDIIQSQGQEKTT